MHHSIDFHQSTHPGCARADNQDAIGRWEVDDGLVFAVADGLGGYSGGRLASSIALDGLSRAFAEMPERWPIAKKLRRAFQNANLEIYQKAITVPDLRGMGTTLTATAILGSGLVTAHVGDCRLLLLRHGELLQLTRDHSWVGEQVRFGILSPAQARVHRRRNLLTRSLGRELILAVDVLSTELRAGDRLLQCSDGVHAALAPAEIVAALEEACPEAACQSLLERVLDAGGADNLSAQVAMVRSLAAPARRSWLRFAGQRS